MTAATKLKRPPEQAGSARIRFAPGEAPADYLAGRKGDDITIYQEFRDVDVYSLMGGQQLVVAAGLYDPVFMGTDEATFATVLPWHAFDALADGEEAFYDSLKPEIIQWLEVMLGADAVGRQGDIWWAELCGSAEEFAQLRPPKARSTQWIPITDRQVSRTRHTLTGQMVRQGTKLRIQGQPYTHRGNLLAAGTISAPDHADQTFGPAIVARTPGMEDIKRFSGSDEELELLGFD